MRRIRRATAGDEDAVLALADRLCEGVARWRDPEAVLTAVRGWVESSLATMEDPGHAVLVAELDGTVVGFVTLSPTRHWSGEPEAEASIGELVVSQQAQGRGIGSALVEAAMARARELGCARISVSTGAANARARDLYRRLGFEDEDVSSSRALG